MAVTRQLDKVSVKMKLNNGRDEAGNVKTVTSNLGSLDPTGYDAQKAVAVVNALTPLFSKGIHAITEVDEYTLIDE